MKKFFWLVFSISLLLVYAHHAHAQTNRYRSWHHHFDFGAGFWKKENAFSLGWSHLKGIGRAHRFKLGYGLRLNLYRGNEREFLPIPRDLRRDETRTDTLVITKARPFSLALGLYMQYDLAARWTLGANVDLVGFAVSLKKISTGVLYSTDLLDSAFLPTTVSAHKYGLFKARTEDFGTLNAELYLAYHLLPKWRIKFGVQKLWTEYRTPLPFVQNNTRYFRHPWLALVGLTFTPFTPNIKCPKLKRQKLKKLKEGEY
jgi:hypothetical protein